MNVQDRVAIQLLDDARAAQNRGHSTMLVTPGERLEALRFIASQDGGTVDVGSVRVILRGVLLVEVVPAVDLERAQRTVGRIKHMVKAVLNAACQEHPRNTPVRIALQNVMIALTVGFDIAEHGS